MCWVIWRAIKRGRTASYAAVLDAQLDERTFGLRLAVRNGSQTALVIDKIAVGSSWSLAVNSDGQAMSRALPRDGWARIVNVWQPLSINEGWETKLLVRHSGRRLLGRMTVKLDVRVCNRRVRRKRKKMTVLLSHPNR